MRRILGGALWLIGLGAAVVIIFREGPVGPIPGGRLGGAVVETPVDDWSFSDAFTTVALETRPDRPHSVTALCFTLDGKLYVPASNGAQKRWTRYVLEDPRVRVRIGQQIYPGRATRIEDPLLRARIAEAAAGKYERFRERLAEGVPEGLWMFRIDSAPGA